MAGVVATILAPLSLSMSGGASAIINQLPPEMLQQFSQSGVDPSMFLNAATVTDGDRPVLPCRPGLIAGAILGALGGLVYAAAKPE